MASISQHSIDALPYSCTWRILEFLDVIGLREMRTVSRRFKLFADGDRVWQIHAAPFLKKANASQAAPTHGFRSIFYQNLKLWAINTMSDGMTFENHVLKSEPSLTNWGTAVVNYPRIRTRKQYCEFMVIDSREGYLEKTHKIVVGVVPENFEVTMGHCIGEGQSFGYILQNGNKVGYGGADPVAYGAAFTNGDRIGVLADPVANEISFYKNGVCQGVAFSKFMDTDVRSYQFAVSLVRSNMSVRIMTEVMFPKEGLEASVVVPPPAVSELPLNRFPGDILTSVFQRLPANDVNAMRLVKKEWNRLASSDYVWLPAAACLVPDPSVLLSPSLTTYRLAVMRNTHRFSSTVHAPGLELSNDSTTVTSSSTVTYWSAIRLDYPKMRSGVHYAEFHIDVFRHGAIGNTWKMVCGVVSEEFDYVLTKWVGVDGKSFGFIAANGKAVGPLCKNLGGAYADGFMENDRIGVLVDFPADQITFYKNGVNLGVAFDGFSKQVQLDRPETANYYFAVSLARWGMQITVIPDARCPDRDISIC
jgi:hypothetical protein